MGMYDQYWTDNTFEMNEKISRFKDALKTSVAKEVSYKRIGSINDGGYILVDDINKDDHLISFGVEGNVDFEKEARE